MIMILVAWLGAYSFVSIKCPLRARFKRRRRWQYKANMEENRSGIDRVSVIVHTVSVRDADKRNICVLHPSPSTLVSKDTYLFRDLLQKDRSKLAFVQKLAMHDSMNITFLDQLVSLLSSWREEKWDRRARQNAAQIANCDDSRGTESYPAFACKEEAFVPDVPC